MIYLSVDENLSLLKVSKEIYDLLGDRLTQSLADFLFNDDIFKLKGMLRENSSFICKLQTNDGIKEVFIKTLDQTKLNDGRNEYKIVMIELNDFYEEYKKVELKAKVLESLTEFMNVELFVYDKKLDELTILHSQDSVSFKGKLEDINNLDNVKYKAIYKALMNNNFYGKHVIGEFEVSLKTIKILDLEYITGSVVEKNVVLETKDKYDFLTGLLNKKEFLSEVKMALKQDNTVMVIDIDNFKTVNDTYGHKTGDDVIRIVADSIKDAIKSIGFAGRFGGDEIVVFLNTSDEPVVRSICETIRVNVQYNTRNFKIPISVSIGLARTPIDATNYEDLFKIADKALYIAKNKGKNRYIIYREAMHKNVINRRVANIDRIFVDLFHIFSLDVSDSKKVEIILKEIKLRFNFSQINVYFNNELNLSFDDDVNYHGVLNDEYINKFDERGVLVVNNAMPIKANNPTGFSLYEKQGVLSYVHILIKKAEEVIGYISFEDKAEQRSYTTSEINVLYCVTEIIKEFL